MQPTDRLHALDAVRAFALLTGIALHATMPWLQDLPLWNIVEPPNAGAAAIWYFIHLFRMPVFFLIAGFFGRLLLERRGTRAFVKDRAKRIALPLLVGGIVVGLLTVLAFALGSLASGMTLQELMAFGQAQQAQQAQAGKGGGAGLGHLWFLYYLLMFYAAALALRALFRVADAKASLVTAIDRALRGLMRTGLAAVVFGLPVAVWYAFAWPQWPGWNGLPAPFSFVPSVPALLAYGLFFGVGWLLHRQADLLLQLRERWVAYSIAAVALAIVCYTIAGPTPHWSPYLTGTTLQVYAATYLVATWCSSFALIGVALRFLSDPSPVSRYLADSSYWLYLMHLPALVFFLQWLHPLDWHWSVKFSLTLLGSIPLLLLSYHAFVRFTFIGAILNGRRHPRKVMDSPRAAHSP